MHDKDTIQIHTESGTLYAAPPVPYWIGETTPMPAQLEYRDETFSLPPADAELLARTIAPQLLDTAPLQAIYDDLEETVQSYIRDHQAAEERPGDVDSVLESMGDLLGHVKQTLQELAELLPSE